MSRFDELREQFPTFIYRDRHFVIVRNSSSECDGDPDAGLTGSVCKITFDFEIPGLSEFHPTWEFPVRRRLDAQDQRILGELVFQLGMAETISYYKITCPRRVVVECGSLTQQQQLWWQKLYYNGLGEFMYRNGIEVSQEELVTFACRTPQEAGESKPYRDASHYEGILVPVGGGKDSVVTLETLRGQDIMTYHINDDSAIDEVIEVFRGAVKMHRRARGTSGSGERTKEACPPEPRTGAVGGAKDCRARRSLDPNMLRLNAEGYLNGHTPFSAIVAFSGVIAAFLNGRAFVALSNETSANETTVRGSFVNHQYSKSREFEEDFQRYFQQITTSDIRYFSFLRPLSEIQIAALFAGFKAYHPVFLSCNRGGKQGIWCADCPKCLFVYIILSPFLSGEELQSIFGERLLDKPSLEKDFRGLVGLDENKPFECVGTRGEVVAALKYDVQRGMRSLLTDRYRREILASGESLTDYLKGWGPHHVPVQFEPLLRKKLLEATQEFQR